MLEFQGDFEHSDIAQFDSLTLGSMKAQTNGVYELMVGNHLIKGKISDLPKPIIMTEKVVNEAKGDVEFKIKAVLRRKIVFGSRPTPLRTGGGRNADE